MTPTNPACSDHVSPDPDPAPPRRDGFDERFLVGSQAYQSMRQYAALAKAAKSHKPGVFGITPHFSPTSDTMHQLRSLDTRRAQLYDSRRMVAHEQSNTGHQLAPALVNVLELETAVRACDLTLLEQEALSLALTGLERGAIAERMNISPRLCGNVIGQAINKVTNYLFD